MGQVSNKELKEQFNMYLAEVHTKLGELTEEVGVCNEWFVQATLDTSVEDFLKQLADGYLTLAQAQKKAIELLS